MVGCGKLAQDDEARNAPTTNRPEDAGYNGGDDSGDAATTPPPLPDEATFTCTPPLPILSNVTPAVPVDYVELRSMLFDLWDDGIPDTDGGSDADSDPKTESTHGSPCAGGSSACFEELAAQRIGKHEGWSATGEGDTSIKMSFLVYTRGDEVGVVKSPQDLATFLGTVDTLEEARLLVTTRMRDLVCTTIPFKSGWRQNPDGSWEFLITWDNCGNPTQTRMKVSADGVVTRGESRRIDTGSVCGRRPAGLAPGAETLGATVSVAAWLAEAAHLEAASVIAFRRLERELLALGAPRELIVGARRSRADEIRHAREMTLLAHRFGAAPARVMIMPFEKRSVFEIALENAVEGCVRETYGALVAEYQARMAVDPEIRAVLRRVASDEARHAALAHDVAAWLAPRLDDAERAAIGRARAVAMADLRAAVLQPSAEDVVALAGMPRPREAQALLDAMAGVVLTGTAA